MDFFTLIILILSSFIAGIIGSFLGIGGGTIIVPVLTYFGYPIEFSIPASLVAIFGNSLIATLRYSYKKIIKYSISLKALSFVLLGALLGSYTFLIIEKKILFIIFGIVLLILAFYILKFERIKIHSKFAYPIFTAGGYISNLLGMGGGILFTPLLHLIFRLELKSAVATSLLMIVIITGLGSLIYYLEEFVILNITIPVLVGAVLGSFTGSYFMLKIKEKYQKTSLIVLLISFSFLMMIKGIV